MGRVLAQLKLEKVPYLPKESSQMSQKNLRGRILQCVASLISPLKWQIDIYLLQDL